MPKRVAKNDNCDLYVRLRDAIKKRNKKEAQELLLNNTMIEDIKRKSAHSLIHWAILKFEDVDILKILIDQGGDIYAKNNRRQTPLNLAVQLLHVKAIKLLLDKKAYIGDNFKSLLEIAINMKSETVVKLLITCGVKNKLFRNLNTSLDLAVSKGLPGIVKMIVPHCRLGKDKRRVHEIAVLIGGQKFNACLNILLQHGFKMESGCEENDSFVFDSVKHGYLYIMKELLTLGLNVDMRNTGTGLTLLHTACLYKQHKVAELLLKNKADVNSIIEAGTLRCYSYSMLTKLERWPGKTAIYIVVENADLKMLETLLSYGANISYEPEFVSLIGRVIKQNHLEILHVLIKHGFNVEAKLANGKTLLHECATCEIRSMQLFSAKPSRFKQCIEYQAAQLLLDNGADIEAQGYDRETPLFIALKSNSIEMVEFFLKNKANVHHKNIDGNTSFHVIAQETGVSTTIVKRLLKYGVNVNELNPLDITPFQFACSKWSAKVIEILINHGGDINWINQNGQKALHFAAAGQDFEIIELLLTKGTCPNDRDYSDRTPLHILCNQLACPRAEVLKLFLQYGADIDALDIHKKTPLFYACKRGHLKAVKALLAHHAKVNHVDVFGMTPVYVAAECSTEVARFLMSRKTTITKFITQEGKTLLHALVEEKRHTLIEQFMNILNVHIDAVDNFGKTPLHYAAAAIQEKTVITLLQYGADINITTNQKPTIPMYIYARVVKIHQDLTQVLNNIHENWNEHNNYILVRRQYIPYWKKLRYYKRIMSILRQHLIKLKTAHMSIHPQNVRFSINDHTNTDVYNDDIEIASLEAYELICKTEVENLQMTNIPDTNFCLHDMLIIDIHILASHIDLEKIKLFLKQTHLSTSFPIYIDLIKYRLSKALRRKKLLSIARNCSESSIFFGLPAFCTNQIFSYISNNDMENFNQAIGVTKFMSNSERDNSKILLETQSTQFLRQLTCTRAAESDEPDEKVVKKLKTDE
ncbi:putative ankyrin repeat protein RF_0381 [Chelonus insularis]|uniref:putative ankyrin repeat protein RF_0381 n=1 Tax=Chelonus insularis TaxID=460826 RepID=UPI00158A3A8B|nr:putative ankyrin repeat protein RF_0381 [Chelonus insularis]